MLSYRAPILRALAESLPGRLKASPSENVHRMTLPSSYRLREAVPQAISRSSKASRLLAYMHGVLKEQYKIHLPSPRHKGLFLQSRFSLRCLYS